MRHLAYHAAIAALLAGSSACARDGAWCCGGTATSSSSATATNARSPGIMSLTQVADRVRSQNSSTFIFDANPREMYEKRHLPRARWVPYDGLAPEMMPSDRTATLVFYCANPQCSASPQAARSAIALGWTNVYVMPEGIFGWVRAGLPLEPA